MQMRSVAASLVILPWCSVLLTVEASAQSRIRAIEVYGSEEISSDDVIQLVGDEIEALAAQYDERHHDDYQQQKSAIEERIDSLGDFASVALTVLELYSADRPIYVTVDVVHARDRESRMAFQPVPTTELPDPGGLLASWNEYEQLSSELFRLNELPSIRANAFHSLWGFDHPDLADYGERFDVEVEQRKAELLQVLRESADERDRAAAAFLLAHVRSVDELIDMLVPQIDDPSPLVRNNVMRVLASVARNHDGVPIEPVIKAVRYPTATDRNKALAILRFQVTTAEARQLVIREVGNELLAMLRLQTPVNHNLAHVVLERISDETFSARDYDAWEKWLREARQR